MNFSRQEAAEKLAEGCRAYYNVIAAEENQRPLLYSCEFFQKAEGYVLFRKANIWVAEAEEFVYIYCMPKLTEDLFEKIYTEAYIAGKAKAHIGTGHMCTYVTVVFFCDECTDKARELLQKRSKHEMFMLSFHGWLDMRLAVYESKKGTITRNKAAEDMEKLLLGLLKK